MITLSICISFSSHRSQNAFQSSLRAIRASRPSWATFPQEDHQPLLCFPEPGMGFDGREGILPPSSSDGFQMDTRAPLCHWQLPFKVTLRPLQGGAEGFQHKWKSGGEIAAFHFAARPPSSAELRQGFVFNPLMNWIQLLNGLHFSWAAADFFFFVTELVAHLAVLIAHGELIFFKKKIY